LLYLILFQSFIRTEKAKLRRTDAGAASSTREAQTGVIFKGLGGVAVVRTTQLAPNQSEVRMAPMRNIFAFAFNIRLQATRCLMLAVRKFANRKTRHYPPKIIPVFSSKDGSINERKPPLRVV
jgi:hypothetical protein